MSQYKGYYTTGTNIGGSQEIDNTRHDGRREESQEQDFTEYADNGQNVGYCDGDDTEYDPGGTSLSFDQQSSGNYASHLKRSHSEANHQNDRLTQVRNSWGLNTISDRSQHFSLTLFCRSSNLRSYLKPPMGPSAGRVPNAL